MLGVRAVLRLVRDDVLDIAIDEVCKRVPLGLSEREVASAEAAVASLLTDADADPVAMYAFDAELFADGKGSTNENTRLSSLDQKTIAKMYLA